MPYCMAGAAPVTGERDATRRERGVDGDTRDALFCQLDSETFVLLQRKGATAAPHHVYSAPAPEARRHHARTFAHDITHPAIVFSSSSNHASRPTTQYLLISSLGPPPSPPFRRAIYDGGGEPAGCGSASGGCSPLAVGSRPK